MPAIGAAIGAIGSAIGAMSIGAQIAIRLAISIASSALMQALVKKPRTPGIKNSVRQTGGDNPLSFVLMTYATAGTRVCPPMSHGSAGKTPNAYLTEVLEVGCIAGQALRRVIINDEYVTLGPTAHPDYGFPVTGDLAGFAWVKYYDGTQTAADPMLLAKYGSYPQRPWNADMIGRGLCYVIVTCRYSTKKWKGEPRFKFEMGGIPLYDPRKDSTVGGSGAHRWANKATWEPSVNPAVAIYNVKRGISMIDGSVWGGRFDAGDLPLATWFAAMNECDLAVSDGASGTEAQFRAGLEVSVDEKPADIIDELLKVCAGQVAEVGGAWKIRVGPPGTPVYSFTDADILITESQDFSPFPSFADSYNGVHASYPDPESLWEVKEAPPLYNAGYEAADQAQRLVADLSMPACPYGAQVRRVQSAYIKEERRFRRHTQFFPPDAALVEPLDSTAWTSVANGYTTKSFEVAEIYEDPMNGWRRMSLRERDAADFSYPAGLTAPVAVSAVSVIPASQGVPGFAVAGDFVPDATGAARRPALALTWDGDQDDATGITWEIRLTVTGVVIARGSTHEVATGQIAIAEGILPSTAYEARAKLIADREMVWTSWTAGTTPATPPVTRPDIADGAVSDIITTISLSQQISTFLADRTFATLDLGAIAPGVAFNISVQFEARQDITGTSVIVFQSRYQFGGSGFTAWATEMSFTVTGTTYQMYSHFGGLAGTYGDYEYRLNRPLSGDPVRVRNIYMTASRAVK
jgi:hypothetical protein